MRRSCGEEARRRARTGWRRDGGRGPCPASWTVLALAVAVASASAPIPTAGQVPDWLFPDRALLPDLLAGARDPVVKGQLVYADPDPTAFGPGPSGEVAIAGTVPVALLAGRSAADALVVGLEGAAFARFAFHVVTRELVNTDWIFAVPLVWHRGDHWLRLRYYHTSSHLGDEYQRRFGPSSVNFSRDGADLTGYLRPPLASARRLGLGVYAGVLWSVNSHPEETALWRGRAGLEVDPAHGRLWRPFGALDVEVEEGRPGSRWTAQAGVWLPRVHGRPLRLALEILHGPSPLGQFHRTETRRVALGLHWNP